jgi:hypothetical protein
MSDIYYGVAPGGDRKTDVTENTSTNSTVIELRVTDSDAGATRLQVLKAINAIREYIIHDTSLKP